MNLPFELSERSAEVGYALRTLRRSPLFTVTVVITLALGIGANALTLSFASALFLRPLPYERTHELVGISTTHRTSRGRLDDFMPNGQDLVAYAQRNGTLASVGGIDTQSFALQGPDGPQTIQGGLVTASLFEVFGTKAAAGRTFTAEEDRVGSTTAVISATLQQRLFPGAADMAIGRPILIDGTPRTVVGVMPPGYRPRLSPGDVWLPMGITASNPSAAQKMQIVGRMKTGVTIDEVRADLARIATALAVELPDNHRDWGVSVTDLREKIGDSTRGVTLTLCAAVCFLLLLTCANVTNLALVRAARRRPDVSTRLALGASRSSIVRHQLFEGLLLGGAGGLVGTLLAALGLGVALRLLANQNNLVDTVGLDARVLTLVGLLSILVGTVCSVLPGQRVLESAAQSTLAGSGRRQSAGRLERRTHRVLMTLQVAAAAILLVGSLSAVDALRRVDGSHPGFEAEDVHVARVTLSSTRYPGLAERSAFVDGVLEKLVATPGVISASIVTNRFVAGEHIQAMLAIDGAPTADPFPTELRRVTPDYFTTLGIPLLRGRAFTTADREGGASVAIVNRSFARRYLEGREPVGARVKRRTGGWIEIVGLVPDVNDLGQGVDLGPMAYMPFAQFSSASASFVIKTRLAPNSIERAVREAVAAVDSGQPVEAIVPLPRLLDETLGEARFKTLTLALLSGLALAVAGLGIYGVTACVIEERSTEVAIRMAHGAQPSGILRQFLLDASRFVTGGAVFGLMGALILGHGFASLAPDVAAADAVVYGVTGILLVAVGLTATVIPTLRATRISPALVLRSQ